MICFVDTNIFLYGRDSSEPEKRKLAQSWISKLWQQRAGATSVQVLCEYYSVCVRKKLSALELAQIREEIEDLFLWQPKENSCMIVTDAWRLQSKYAISWWDSLIVATALQMGADILLSEDFQDQQEFKLTREVLQIVNPFKHNVSKYLE